MFISWVSEDDILFAILDLHLTLMLQMQNLKKNASEQSRSPHLRRSGNYEADWEWGSSFLSSS